MNRYNIYAEDLKGNRLFNLGLDDNEDFCIAEVERLNKNNNDEEIVYKYEEVKNES